jgi:hypothetical protein
MTEKVYSYVVIGMITGEHFIEDLKLRVPYRTPRPITEVDFLNSKDLNRAVQQKYVKVVAQASIPTPVTSGNNPVLERRIGELQNALRESENAREILEQKIDNQGDQLTAILAAIEKIPERTVVVAGNGASKAPVSEVVGGDVPMFIPENIPLGNRARINMHESEGEADLGEAAQKLRELRKRQGGG